MRKFISIAVIGIFLLSSFSAFVVGEEQIGKAQITLHYSFEKPTIKDIDFSGILYQQIKIESAPCSGNSGEPNLSTKGVYILIPQKEKVNSITVVFDERIYFGDGYLVEPVGNPAPLSETDSTSYPTPDDTIYSSIKQFPGKLFTEIGTYNCKGYEILVLKLHPIQYIPNSGKLYYYPDLTVIVETVKDITVSSTFRGLKKDELEIIDKVDNSAVLNSYNLNLKQTFHRQSNPLPIYDLLIITTE